MLEGLDEINWSQLSHAYGAASDVPVLIRQLLSKNFDDRDKALGILMQSIWHQGTIYEASSYTVTFLYKLLKSSETPDKSFVAFLLAHLATGKGYFHYELSEKDKQKWRTVFEKQGKSLEKEIAEEIEHEKNVHQEIEKEFSLLYPYLFCDQAGVRDVIAKVFGEYPRFKSETLPLLEKALTSENDEFAKKAIENSIKILGETK